MIFKAMRQNEITQVRCVKIKGKRLQHSPDHRPTSKGQGDKEKPAKESKGWPAGGRKGSREWCPRNQARKVLQGGRYHHLHQMLLTGDKEERQLPIGPNNRENIGDFKKSCFSRVAEIKLYGVNSRDNSKWGLPVKRNRLVVWVKKGCFFLFYFALGFFR